MRESKREREQGKNLSPKPHRRRRRAWPAGFAAWLTYSWMIVAFLLIPRRRRDLSLGRYARVYVLLCTRLSLLLMQSRNGRENLTAKAAFTICSFSFVYCVDSEEEVFMFLPWPLAAERASVRCRVLAMVLKA